MIFVDYDGTITGETEKAVFIRHDGGEKLTLPKSQIGQFTYPGGDSSEVRIGEVIEAIEIEEWLAEKNGL